MLLLALSVMVVAVAVAVVVAVAWLAPIVEPRDVAARVAVGPRSGASHRVTRTIYCFCRRRAVRGAILGVL